MKLDQYRKNFKEKALSYLLEGNSKEDLADALLNHYSLSDWKMIVSEIEAFEEATKE